MMGGIVQKYYGFVGVWIATDISTEEPKNIDGVKIGEKRLVTVEIRYPNGEVSARMVRMAEYKGGITWTVQDIELPRDYTIYVSAYARAIKPYSGFRTA